jgi:uncharacterized RmlC-like cupin family protein
MMYQIKHSFEERNLKVVARGRTIRGEQGLLYTQGISSQSVASKGLNLQQIRMPHGELAHCQKHDVHETAIYVMKGSAGVWWGNCLEKNSVACTGECIYIPAKLTHLLYNVSLIEECSLIVVHTDPDERSSAVLLPEIEVEWSNRRDVQQWLRARRYSASM